MKFIKVNDRKFILNSAEFRKIIYVYIYIYTFSTSGTLVPIRYTNKVRRSTGTIPWDRIPLPLYFLVFVKNQRSSKEIHLMVKAQK